ncbi:uncharacterized protein B0H18DRAFT_1125328 [Fomitopsis serialis]|uniref:uncharacterized protein n=1 Tax=Fomitopsis serialis TaxID=139415 RepID=UPI002007B3CF|nr:uncharacterized protein B0H18DRAFT_1125328 [Neoantrodia serialis]KAH9914745.1 hypothetical protein B0H18DRAFT_1125328 [Neoantrodia serialis]
MPDPALKTDTVDEGIAKATFNEVSQRLSMQASSSAQDEDIEKGGETTFDLREYLVSSNDANQAAGIKHKHVGVVWEDLQVDVVGGVGHKIYIPTFPLAIIAFFLTPLSWIKAFLYRFFPSLRKQIPTRTVLHKSSGCLKPGEMCLRRLCEGFRASPVRRIEATEMRKHYKGEVLYNHADDVHIPYLTVSQTLGYGLSMKTPGPKGRAPGTSKTAFNNSLKNALLKMLNISHTADTLVGNEFVPGVSGGERKRVSIAEMMTTRARVQCWDNSTRGLDASNATDFVKCLRISTDILGQTTFVSLYQAGENMYELFDKVLLLDKGRQGYKPLPRQTTPDYLTGCTDPHERQFAPGYSAVTVPSTPDTLEDAFCASPIWHKESEVFSRYKGETAGDAKEQEEFRAAVVAEQHRGVSKKSPYTISFVAQVMNIWRRQTQVIWQGKFGLVTGFFLTIVLAIVTGAGWFDLTLGADGAFTRSSVIWTTLLTSCLMAFSELPVIMFFRPIYEKQMSYGLHRPGALPLANTLADMPFSAVRLFLYTMIIYFMTHLERSAGGFFTFYLFNWLAFLDMQAMFRFFGLITATHDAAFRITTFCIAPIILFGGWMIPVFQMKRWLFWISYLNPMSYAFAGCMENEFMRINAIDLSIQFSCDGSFVVPRNPPGLDKYPTGLGSNQVCTLFGALPGDPQVSGKAYLQAAFGLDTADIWRRNFLVLLGWFIFYQILQYLAIEGRPVLHRGSGFRLFVKETPETRALNEALKSKRDVIPEKDQFPSDDVSKVSSQDLGQKHALTWEGLSYHIPVPGGQRQLLHDLYGYVKPGTLTALMGASGAGKTTCLDVLAQRKTLGVVSGDIFVDGRPLDSSFARSTAYAEQMDVHNPTSTVREALRFSAYLRQPMNVPKEEKDIYVEEIIDLLELQDLTEVMTICLSQEAKKRLTIGVELASKPEFLLFLDEPTSGLDSQSAWNIVRLLRKLTDSGLPILCTIHQPSSMLFLQFDRLLLLERGGYTCYFGPIGPDGAVLRDYLARNGAQCPPNANVAEYLLDAIGAGVAPRIGDRDWTEIWAESPEATQVMAEIQEIKAKSLTHKGGAEDHATYATPFLYQLKTVTRRNAIAIWRSPNYIWSRLYVHIFVSLWVSLTFLQLGNSSRDLQYRVFGMCILGVRASYSSHSQVEPIFLFNRSIFIRESSARVYSPEVFAIGQLLGELPYSILCAIVYWVLMVYPMGFGRNNSTGIDGTGFQLLIVIFMELLGVTLGQLIASLSLNLFLAVLFNPFIALILNNFCGVTIPYYSLNHFFKSWLYQLNPYTRTLSTMLSTELHGLRVTCKADEFAIFNPPSGQTCEGWGAEFVNTYGGYIDNLQDSTSCRYCQYAVGDQFYEPLDISIHNRWRDAWVLFAFVVFNMLATIVVSRYLRYNKR